ncbi:MAG: acyl-CoA dehydrogenase family protein [Deltaproteobacteria bacterium]|nr:acyl-CoA dehydrogenase family protein [Deltaproteobacteria bacterium]
MQRAIDETLMNEDQRALLDAIRRWLEKDVKPKVQHYEHADEYPAEFVDGLKRLGLFGATIPAEYGGLGLDYYTYALINEELSRVWMSLSGFINTHLIMAYVVKNYGTEDQKRKYLPRFATGEMRGGLALSEAQGGSDVAGIRCRAVKAGDHYIVNGSKMWITNGSYGNTYLLVVKTDMNTDPAYKGISAFIFEKGDPGFTVSRNIKKLGYKGIETCELTFENVRVPAANLVGGSEGKGFYQVMDGLETGRINVAARAVGVLRAIFEDSARYAQERVTFGKPLIEHQLVQQKLAFMQTDLQAARLLTLDAARKKDRGQRCDLESGMAKLFASSACARHSFEGIQLHGGYGYTSEFDVERYYRDAPLMTVGEGTNEILQTVIARQIRKRYSID